jgi:hypothetical protein
VKKFMDGAKLDIGSKFKVKICRCLHCDMVVKVPGCLDMLSHELLANAFVDIVILDHDSARCRARPLFG